MPESKTVKLGFSLDNRSFEVARGAIRSLTQEVKQLIDAFNKAGSAGGGSILGGVSSKSGAISGAKENTIKGGGAITQGIANDAKAIATSAKAGVEAIKGLTSATKSGLTDQISKIQQLRKELNDLEKAYKSVGGLSGGGGGGGNRGGGGGGGFGNGIGEINTEGKYAGGGITRDKSAGSGSQRMWSQGIKDYGDPNMMGPRQDLLLPDKAKQADWMKSAMGTFGRVMGGVGAVAGAYSLGHTMYTNAESYHAQESSDALGDSLRRRATISQAYGGVGMQVRGRLAAGLAAGNLTPTEMRSALGEEKFNSLLTKAYSDTGNTGALGDIKDKIMSGTFGESHQQRLERALGDMPGMQAEAYAGAVQQRMAAASVRNTAFLDNFDSSYGSRMGLMRQGRMGAKMAMTAGVNSLYTAEEIGGMRGQLAQAAGGAHMGQANRMLGLTYGGLSSAASIYGQAAGYGNGKDFIGGISSASSMYGKAGLVDVSASNQIASQYAGGMTQGDFNTNGAQGMQGMLSTSALFGGDLRSARDSAAGGAAYAAYSAGSTDRLQQGINVLASVQQGGTLYSQEALRGMSNGQMMDIQRKIGEGKIKDTSQLPMELRAQGVTLDMIKGYQKTRDNFAFAEYMPSQGSASVNSAVADFKANGIGGLKKFKGAALRERITELGVALKQSGRADSVNAGKHMMAQMAASDPDLFKAIKGGSVGDAAAGSIEAEHKRNRDQNIVDEEEYVHSKKGKEAIRQGGSKETHKMANELDTMGTMMNVAAASVSKELADLADDIRAARLAIRTGQPGRPKVNGLSGMKETSKVKR